MTRFMAAVVMMVMGCGPARLPGAPEVGKACGDAVPECSGSASISICEREVGRLRLPERACSNNQPKRCDWTRAKIGEPCPASFEGGAVACGPEGSGSVIKCVDGKLVSTPCSTCTDRSSSTTRYFTCS